MECDPLTVLAKDTNLYFLTLGLEINIANLWVSHYSDHQQYLFETITKFRAEGVQPPSRLIELKLDT